MEPETELQEARTAWLEERRTGIGGSDAAAILGLNPYATALDVWLDKKGIKIPGRPGREFLWWGQALEAIIRRRYEETSGIRLVKPEAILRHPQHDCLIASPDGLAVDGTRGWEGKTANVRMAAQWGEPGTDEIPQAYLIQCCHYMLVTQRGRWDVSALLGGSDFRTYAIHADDDLLESIRQRLVEWWERFIVGNEEPEVDGSEMAARWLQQKHPRHLQPLAVAPAEAIEWAARLAVARKMVKVGEEQRDIAENKLKTMIGDALGFDGTHWFVTWKAAKGREVVNWKEMAEYLVNAAAKNVSSEHRDRVVASTLADLKKVFTATGPETRRFLFKSTEEK